MIGRQLLVLGVVMGLGGFVGAVRVAGPAEASVLAPGILATQPIVTTQQSAPRGDYDWPVAGWPRVSRPFQPPLSRYGPGHRGVDLIAAVNSPVLAAGDGTVVFAGELAGRGVVSVQHASGLRTTYEPVLAAVPPGAVVRRGQLIGVLQAGHEGCPAQACLHWGVRRGEDYLDPLRLLGRWQVRLKPWED